jgi:hypothetical protein
MVPHVHLLWRTMIDILLVTHLIYPEPSKDSSWCCYCDCKYLYIRIFIIDYNEITLGNRMKKNKTSATKQYHIWVFNYSKPPNEFVLLFHQITINNMTQTENKLWIVNIQKINNSRWLMPRLRDQTTIDNRMFPIIMLHLIWCVNLVPKLMYE